MADLEREYPGYRGPYRDGRLHVLAEKCATCIYRPGNLMHLDEGRREQIEQDNLDSQSALTCHSTLPYGPHPQAEGAVCRGFYDVTRRRSPILALADVMGIIKEIPCPPST